MRVKMFWINENLAEPESIIDEWLLKNQGVEIKHILQSADGADDGTATSALISIWYEEAKNED